MSRFPFVARLWQLRKWLEQFTLGTAVTRVTASLVSFHSLIVSEIRDEGIVHVPQS
jgi:hypothetical protein